MDVLFLGTGASTPSRVRSMPCIAIRDNSDIILFDCGEGSQRQLMISPFSYMKIKAIFISHMHGDHVFGMPGLLQTMGLTGRKEILHVYGPEGFSERLNQIMSACEGEIEYELQLHDLNPGDVVPAGSGTVKAIRADHGLPALGYVYKQKDQVGKFNREKAESLGLDPADFPKLFAGESVDGVLPEEIIGPARPGMSVAYTGDTKGFEELAESVSNADILIHESTFMETESAMAEEHYHSTAAQAGECAKKANVRMLVLTHISNRYDDRKAVCNEAKAIFEETILADDMMFLEVSRKSIRLT